MKTLEWLLFGNQATMRRTIRDFQETLTQSSNSQKRMKMMKSAFHNTSVLNVIKHYETVTSYITICLTITRSCTVVSNVKKIFFVLKLLMNSIAELTWMLCSNALIVQLFLIGKVPSLIMPSLILSHCSLARNVESNSSSDPLIWSTSHIAIRRLKLSNALFVIKCSGLQPR